MQPRGVRAAIGTVLSVLSLAVWLWPSLARADDRELREAITLEAGASCLDAETLLDQLRVWLKRDQIDARIAVDVHGDPQSKDVVWFVLEREGVQTAERRFDPAPPRCADLHAALGLAIALAIDASVLADLGIEPPAPPPAPPPTPDPVPAPMPVEPKEEDSRLRASGSLLGIGAVGVPGSVGGGGSLRFELGWIDWLDLRFGALGVHAPRTPVGSAAAALTLVAGRVDVCARKAEPKVVGRLCMGPTVGGVLVQGRGFAGENLSGAAPSVALVVGGDLQFHFTPRVGLSLGMEAFVPLVGPVLTVLSEDRADVVTFESLPPIGGILAFGPFFRFR